MAQSENGQFVADAALESESVRLLGNAKTVLWSIDNDELSARENSRLRTAVKKVEELEGIVAERKEGEHGQ